MLFSHLLPCAPSIRLAALGLLLLNPAEAQTFSSCNPITGAQCPANPALGRSTTINLASGAGSDFTSLGATTFGGDGASFTVAQSGAAPQINSKWYIMFGRLDVTLKAAPGTGIVSSVVLQSDDLDEIDWEFLGSKPDEVQSNYFGKGVTGASDRGQTHAIAGTQTGFHTYSVDWTADQIVWQIDGQTVRVLKAANANGQFPQTPMQVKIGSWAGGDTALNAPGTVQWAGGATNFAAGPFSMIVKSVTATDYSTGSSYSYSGTSGTWQSIKSNGGTINSSGSGSSASSNSAQSGSGTTVVAPAITSASTGGSSPPWSGTHRSATTLDPAVSTNYPGLPDGWTVTSSGKVIPPASASPTPSPAPLPSSSPASAPSPAVTPSPSSAPVVKAGGGCETLRGFDVQGMPTTVLVAAGGKISYDDKGNAVGNPACALAKRAASGFVTLVKRD